MAKIIVLANGFPIVTPGVARFSDVPSGNTFFAWIETAAARHIVDGYDNGTFRPYNNVTRGQLSKITVGSHGWQLLDPATPTFADVPQGSPFYRYIESALAHGIISGYDSPEGLVFKPWNGATRGQIAKIVYRAVTD